MTRQRHKFCFIGLLLCSVFLTGCEEYEKVNAEYGQRSSNSVNGTGVLAEMYRQAGYNVITRRSLSPELQRTATVIVWFPDDFNPPSTAHQQWFSTWLNQQAGRTMITVGREHDCEIDYWQELQNRKLSTSSQAISQRLLEAKARIIYESAKQKWPQVTDWYEFEQSSTKNSLQTLTGPWAKGIVAGKTNLSQHSYLYPLDDATTDVLLTWDDGTDDYPFVIREEVSAVGYSSYSVSTSQRIMINNGSFLLNYALINVEHRKLAAQLINETAKMSPTGTVVFLESAADGPQIRKDNSLDSFNTRWDLLKVQPLGMFLCHLAVLGIIYCFMKWPIFGRPRPGKVGSLLNFREHFIALGRLLERSTTRHEAQQRLEQYQRQVAEQKPWHAGHKPTKKS